MAYELNQKCLKKNPSIKKFEWDHRKETYEYCKSDVEILCASMNIYSKNSMKIAGIDPLHFTTIASYCFSVFRTEFYNNEKYPLAILTQKEYDFIKRGFRGGRTESFQLYRKWSDEELSRGCGGRYVDICSLYPTVQYYDYMLRITCFTWFLTLGQKQARPSLVSTSHNRLTRSTRRVTLLSPPQGE